MQFQVPQFIDTEDKIVGPLSLKQFGYICASIGLSFMLYFMVASWLWLLLSIFILALGAALALVKVNGRPFSRILLSAMAFYWEPQTYVWLPDKPNLPKTAATVEEATGGSFSLESVVAGMALKSAWHKVQLGSRQSEDRPEAIDLKRKKERFEVFGAITGERKVAKRVDYR